jgi:hypothetical protein
VDRDRIVVAFLALALALAPAAVARAGDPAVARLDCDNVDAAAVRDVLSHAPAPRVMLVAGSLPFVTMEPFARFLVAMGYPEDRIRDPRSGALSISGYEDSLKLAGMVAWYYEHDGMAPVLIGHSRGGMLVLRTLHELAGAFHDSVPVFDPDRDESLARTTIVDPYTGRTRPAIGVQVPYAAAIATGKLPRLLQGQWSMLSRLRVVPDTVRDFTGFRIEGDLIAGDFGDDPYVAQGSAHVRNVTLPSGYSHIEAARTAHLAADPVTRAWIDAWRPGSTETPPAGHDTTNILHAADIWYGVKRAWCRSAQARAQRGGAS